MGCSRCIEGSAGGKAPVLPGLDELHAKTTGDPRVTIAVLDGPVDTSHPCFEGARLKTLKTLAPAKVGEGDASRHGTHIASVIFGQPGSPVRGVAPRCRGLIIPVFRDRKGGGIEPCAQTDLAHAITQAVDAGAHVINISGGEIDPEGEAQEYLTKAIERCSKRGVLIVAAAGNDGCDCLHVPAALPSVLAVGAMDSGGEPLTTSNWGEAYRAQGVLALGEKVPGALPSGGVTRRTGTSFATPIVSGVAGLLVSLQVRQGKDPNPPAVRQAILETAIGCEMQPSSDCRRVLVGRLDIRSAQQRLEKGEAMEEQKIDQSEQLVAAAEAGDEREEPVGATPVETTEPEEEEVTVVAAEPPPSALAASEDPTEDADGGEAKGAAASQEESGSSLAYVIGQLGHDLPSQARRDSLLQGGCQNPDDPVSLLSHLADNPSQATAVTWTLNHEGTPIYAVQPAGPFAREIYAQLLSIYGDQYKENVLVDRVSIPCFVVTQGPLSNGQTVPVVVPEARGIRAWSVKKLLDELKGGKAKADDVANFLERVYYELRNLGRAPEERAINFAATEAYQVDNVFAAAVSENLKLDSIACEPSPVCRPDSECWDVKLTFFNPKQRLEQARRVYRFTVDVSDVVPVKIGGVRHWDVY